MQPEMKRYVLEKIPTKHSNKLFSIASLLSYIWGYLYDMGKPSIFPHLYMRFASDIGSLMVELAGNMSLIFLTSQPSNLSSQ